MNIPISGRTHSTNPTFMQIKVTGPIPRIELARQCINARKDRANQILVKLVITTTLAFILTPILGISTVITLCAAVTLGELLAYGICRKTCLPSYMMRPLLFLNAVALVNPVFGLIVSGFTFGIAEKQIAEKNRRRFYKSVSVGVICVALTCLFMDNFSFTR